MKKQFMSNFDDFNGVCGIYHILFWDKIVYVGKSVDLGKRIREHQDKRARYKAVMKENEKFQNGFENHYNAVAMYDMINEERYSDLLEIEVFPCIPESANILETLESMEIQKYQPMYNWKGTNREEMCRNYD